MSTWTNVPYSYLPGVNRLTGPVNLASNPSYDFQARNTLVQDATEFSKGEPYYQFNTTYDTAVAPNFAPSIPDTASYPTSNLIRMYFNVAGVTANPPPTYSFLYGTTPNPTTVLPAVRAFGSLYTGIFGGLAPNTTYYFKSVATNIVGSKISAVSAPQTTTGGGGTPPSAAPTVPTLVTATSTSISIQFDAAGITGTAPIVFSGLCGETPDPLGPLVATLVSGTTYAAVASGLTPNTQYYFKSQATNPAGLARSTAVPFSTLPTPPPSSLQSLYIVDFLLYDGTQWVIDQQNIPDIGQWFLTGGQAGQIQANTGKSVIPYLKSLQTQGCKVIVSFGGGGLSNAILNVMFANPQQTAASICYALLTKGTGTNPLNFAKAGTPWADFAFDGLDMDIETNTPQPDNQLQLLLAIKTLVPSAILTAAPQAPNLTSANAFGGNGNGTWYPFPHVYPSDTLANYNPAVSTSAWMYPGQMQACGLNYLFVQFYNQGPSWYPGTPGTSFPVALAMWGWLCVEAQATIGTGAKVIVGFATTDGNPIWNQSTDSFALQAAIPQANALIVAQGGRYASVVPDDWLAGWGAWNAPSANSVAATIYSPSGNLTNLPAIATMIYTNNSGSPSANPAWTGPVPNTR